MFLSVAFSLFVVSQVTALVNDKQCGLTMHTRIYGGHPVRYGAVPWQVSLRLNHPVYGKVDHFCGGVLITNKWILTAAHCIATPKAILNDPTFWKARLGEHRLKQKDDHERIHDLSYVISHPQFGGYKNDIGLMKLKTPTAFSDYIRPACLPSSSQRIVGEHCYASGWGKVDENTRTANTLQIVEVKVFPSSQCNNVYFTRFHIPVTETHVCAGTLQGGIGTCRGDSGGPLTCKKDNRYYVAGLTSFGSNCVKPGFPDVYTKVSSYLNWIENTMRLSP